MFKFKQFDIINEAAMRVGTDGVLLGACATPTMTPVRILDAGCGTGVIALMAAQRWSGADIDAIEVDDGSVTEALYNVSRSPWPDRVHVIHGDLLSHQYPTRYDLILSNPPFFIEDTRSPEHRRALARHGEGFDTFSLIELSSRILNDGGTLAFIAPASNDDSIIATAALSRLMPVSVTDVVTRAGKPARRRIWHMCRQTGGIPVAVRRDELCIRDADNIYTQKYRELTAPYYTHLN